MRTSVNLGPDPEQQSEGTSDRMLTKKIRQSIVADKSISTYGHNVKIITRDGTVTLKGPVRSDAEKKAVEAKALEVVGTGHMVSELSIVPPSKNQ